jgi:predicted nucleic acid-binding protein
MLAVDTSVVIAGFATWHEGHAAALIALARRPRLPAAVLVETYSVLTRLPPPHRVSPQTAAAYLKACFTEPLLGVPAGDYRRIVDHAVDGAIAGGAVYDAVVAWSAKRAGATLLTRDQRAIPVYEAVGVEFELATDSVP